MAATVLSSTRLVTKNWWLSILIGIVYIVLGVWVFRTPLASYISLSIIFSVFIFISGILEIIFSISNIKKTENWAWYLVGGILDLIMGVLLISHPVMTMTILPLYVGFWLLFRGIIAIGISIQSKSFRVSHSGWMLVSGIATIIFAILVLANPVLGGLSIVYMTSFSFIMIGLFRIFLGFEFKRIKNSAN